MNGTRAVRYSYARAAATLRFAPRALSVGGITGSALLPGRPGPRFTIGNAAAARGACSAAGGGRLGGWRGAPRGGPGGGGRRLGGLPVDAAAAPGAQGENVASELQLEPVTGDEAELL